jgi:hypothetical protein
VAVMTVAILDPTNGSIDSRRGFVTATRPATLEGQTFGIMANGLGDSEIMFDALYAQLSGDGLRDVVKVVKASVAVAPYPEEWDRFVTSATVAVTGLGGCGSCSTRSMRDALDLEAVGIPAVCIVHTALVPAVRAMARLVGCPDYPFVTIDYPHNPTGVWTKEEAVALAHEIAPAVRQRLTQAS